MKRWRVEDRRPCRKYKKRHLKDLGLDEVHGIIEAAQEPFRTHKDVAQQFRVPVPLVGGLVRDSLKRPEKIEALTERALTLERKKDAIEKAATEMLRRNMPIVRAQQVQVAAQEKSGL